MAVYFHRLGTDQRGDLLVFANPDEPDLGHGSLKFAAAVQHAAGGTSEQPLPVRVEVRAAHGLGKPTIKLIDESADVFAFLLHHLAVTNRARSL